MKYIRGSAWLAVVSIVVLSTVPGEWRPHVMGNSYYEHFTAYFITASLLTIAYSRPMQLVANSALLTACAGVLEITQFSIPGRNPSIGDFSMGTMGAWVGIVVTCLVSCGFAGARLPCR